MMELKQFEKMILALFVLSSLGSAVISYGIYLILSESFSIDSTVAAVTSVLLWVAALTIFGIRHTRAALRPTISVYQALEHLAAGTSKDSPPNPEAHGISRDVVARIIKDVYQISSGQHDAQTILVNSKEFAESILALQSNPVLVMDRNRQIVFANKAAVAAMPESVDNHIGMTLEDIYAIEFSSGQSLNDWLADAQTNKIQARHVWERVRITKTNDAMRYFDLVADYNRNESHNIETIIVLIDKTASYHGDDDALGFVSLAVHELRSPISLLRGYVEVFEDELSDNLNDEQRLFMQKMSVSAGQLSTFVNNILNVAKIENDQLKIHMHEDTVYDALNASMEDFTTRAQVRNRKLTYNIADGIPTIGIDRVGIYEVLSNLIDNAIKYSKDEGEIILSAELSADNQISFSVQDFGVGIPESSMENLFDQFYRSHHSRDKVAGSGLGLFISKTIIEAHGGTIWVKSIPGEGSTFGFDLPTYEVVKSLPADQSSEDTQSIVRSAHGWIKNHGKVRK